MPLYGYRCTKCGHRFDKIQKFSDEPETVCPKCGGALERPLTVPALQFKGAGWYVNDYAAKPAGGGDKISAEAAPAGETKASESKTAESKPSESKPAESKAATVSSAPSGGSSPAASTTSSKSD